MANVNNMTFNQLATVLNEIVSMATGKTSITPVNTAEFVSVAQTALKTGYDPVINAVSQVLSRTIFSVRPYYRKFGGLMVDNITYGNHVRKLNPVDTDWEDDQRLEAVDGASIDMYKVNAPEVLQTNLYGYNQFQRHLTLYRDQLDVAFTTPDEFNRFVTMVMGNASDMIEQAHEGVARATLVNFIGGKIAANNGVVHLLTEYNAETGLSLTTGTVMQPDNYDGFVRWLYGKVWTISDLLTERTQGNHINVTGKEISRHTPRRNQKMYINSQYINRMDSVTRSMTWDNAYLKVGDYEGVNYWQAEGDPYKINVTPGYLNNDGKIVSPESPVEQDNIFGVIFDEEAIGITVGSTWSGRTPFNAAGGYSNVYWHFTDRYWNDFTENGIVLLLD